MSIIIKRNNAANAITFKGSTQPVYWNGMLSAEVDSQDNNLINIINNDASNGSKIEYEYYKIEYTSFLDEDSNSFSSAQETVDYINDVANQPSPNSGFQIVDCFDGANSYIETTILEDVFSKLNANDSGIKSNNTFVEGEIAFIYNSQNNNFTFKDLKPKDYCIIEVDYTINADVIDSVHTLRLKLTENDSITETNKDIIQQEVVGADEDIQYNALIAFTIGNELVENSGTAGIGEIFISSQSDATVKLNSYTVYLNR